MDIAGKIKEKALELGFDLAGITSASAVEGRHQQIFGTWLKSDYAGRMEYMRRNPEKRFDPGQLLDGAESVVVVGLNYKSPKQNIVESGQNGPFGRVAGYACYEDYHGFIRKLLRRLAQFIIDESGRDVKFRICVDSAPLAERALAVRAGLGFIGRNHMLINPRLGPEILLGELITNIALEQDKPTKSNCDACDKCIKACPTGALRPDGQFDARRCISYLTIEYRGQVEKDLAGRIGNRLFGCDECVLACPYRHGAPLCRNSSFKYYPDRSSLALETILNMSGEDFAGRFPGSPLLRPGLNVLQRNARICMENSRQG